MKNRRLTRLRGFDYSNSRNYFVTICVKDKIRSLGKIENKVMQLSPEGIIAEEQLLWLADQYPYIDLISFIIMPDHIHCIININSGYYNNVIDDVIIRNGRDRSLHKATDGDRHKIKPLPELIGAFKTTASKRIHLSGNTEFGWQKSYHDHIIRNARSLIIIQHYIESNPERFV